MSTPLSVLDEMLPIEQIKFDMPLARRTLTAQVYRATIGSQDYAVKLFLPYSTRSRDINRVRLRAYNLSDDELEARFYAWRREVRVYQHIDKYIQGPDRQFFPRYYGATKLSRKLCPRGWGYVEDTGDIPIIILELLDGKEVHNEQYELQASDSTREVAQKLYNEDGIDAEYVHIYIHCMEKIEALHNGRAIHGDVKPDIFMNHTSVIIDFGRSWSWEEGKDKQCLDPFRPRQGPTSFEMRRKIEWDSIRTFVTREHNEDELLRPTRLGIVPDSRSGFSEPTLRERVPFLRDCSRCQQAVNEIIAPTTISETEQEGQEGLVVVVEIGSTR
ncbi:hypothetical protein V498_02569 [Pseudogymnoascus sp. VKM F-4517 (FW-2822)]|nr:hypothetical protein V498_02569 [Pseudogymnoascus sp. VKM F-4517 (FW-2822)]